MLERRLAIRNPLGLHARAAAQLVRLSNQYQCEITLMRDQGSRADARSILSILHLAAAYGSEVTVIVSGEDESDALVAIEDLFTTGFGEI